MAAIHVKENYCDLSLGNSIFGLGCYIDKKRSFIIYLNLYCHR